jgi:hypothetical protein
VIDERPPGAPGTRVGALRLEVDDRAGDRVEMSIVAAPGAHDVEDALGSLDQRRHTELTLVDGAGAYLTVGGGNGRYHVYVGAYDHDDRIVLQDPDAAGGPDEEIVVDGRPGRYAARDVVGVDLAGAAARGFLRTGRPDPALTWRTG